MLIQLGPQSKVVQLRLELELFQLDKAVDRTKAVVALGHRSFGG